MRKQGAGHGSGGMGHGAALLLLITLSQLLQSQVPVSDKIIDTVVCRSNKTHSYAIFVPAQYDNKKEWPVILIFDPAARGRSGVEAFLEAGRRYGFILACSNNSRNGQISDNFTAAEAMFRDVTERLRVDQKRIYASGFSGGSRFAMALATEDKRIAGVIGCGAGLSNDGSVLPSGQGFLYYGIAGNRDMNYPEMLDLFELLNSKPGFTPFLRTFAGGHQWPSSDLMSEAVEWIILQGINRKLLPYDQTFISNTEKKTESLINASVSAGDIMDAVRYMKSAARDFNGTAFESGLKLRLAAAQKSQEYKAAVRRWNKMVQTEKESKDTYLRYLGQVFSSASIPDTATTWWQKETGNLARLRDKGSPENSQMASRLLNFISIACSGQGTSFYRSSYFAQAAFLFEICTFSDSKNPDNYYNLARSQAQAGKSKKSVDALTAAVNHGFASRKKIESDPAFGAIRNDPKYKELINRMK